MRRRSRARTRIRCHRHPQGQVLSNIVEQDHRGVKRVTRPMLGFKAFGAAQGTLVGIELMHMIRKKQRRLRLGKRASLRPSSLASLAA